MVMTSFHCYIMVGLSATASAATATAAATRAAVGIAGGFATA